MSGGGRRNKREEELPFFKVTHERAPVAEPIRIPRLAREKGRTKPHYSRWLITINPNIALPKGSGPNTLAQFDATFNDWVSCVFPPDPSNPKWTEALRLGPRGESMGDKPSEILRLITDVHTLSAVEVGKRQHRVHMHLLLELEHFSWLQLDYNGIRNLFEQCDKEMPLPLERKSGSKHPIHVDFKYVGSARPLLNYVMKDVRGTGFENAGLGGTRSQRVDWERLEKMPEKGKDGEIGLGDHHWVMGETGLPVRIPKKKKE